MEDTKKIKEQLKNYRDELLDAIDREDVNAIKNLLDSGINPNHSENGAGYKALHIATQKGNEKLMNLLIKYGAKIDVRTKYGYTPLHIAAHFGNLKMVKFLLKNGAPIRAKTNKRETPVKIALKNDQSKVANYMLETQLHDLCKIN